ncbi:hypothetical protein KC365_g93 [Hortaea werneckii]|nr:hypothetical protein KC365_g93 [Hortaea werneckii]
MAHTVAALVLHRTGFDRIDSKRRRRFRTQLLRLYRSVGYLSCESLVIQAVVEVRWSPTSRTPKNCSSLSRYGSSLALETADANVQSEAIARVCISNTTVVRASVNARAIGPCRLRRCHLPLASARVVWECSTFRYRPSVGRWGLALLPKATMQLQAASESRRPIHLIAFAESLQSSII